MQLIQGKDIFTAYVRMCACMCNFPIMYMQLRNLDPNVQCGLTVYCNSLIAKVDGGLRDSLLVDMLSPHFDWLFFYALDMLLLDFLGLEIVLFCKDDILEKRYVLME